MYKKLLHIYNSTKQCLAHLNYECALMKIDCSKQVWDENNLLTGPECFYLQHMVAWMRCCKYDN